MIHLFPKKMDWAKGRQEKEEVDDTFFGIVCNVDPSLDGY
jgi:hypothetical protein